MIDRSTVDRIYAAANIVEVVGDFVTLKKKGVNYQACCPFHNEKTPSFVVSPSKGLFKCFGCGKGGNAVTFVMEHENMSYPEALKYVGKKYGIDVQERELSPEEERRNDDRESMMVASSYAADYFHKCLTGTDEGRSVGLGYFRQRGFTEATISKFALGYCPAAGDTFTRDAIHAGYREEFLTGAGITVKRDDGRLADRFAGRVIFPIHTVSGRVCAFGGRTLRTDKKTAKYVNSPESEIYHKSRVLYGLFQSKRAITQEDCCILVEGYTDVISMHQSGIENVVASSGTSLTTEQIRLIGRFTRNVTVIYDGDAAGINASMRGIDMILREGMNVRVVALPPDEDPDSFARNNSAIQVRKYIEEHEEDFISFKTRVLKEDTANDPIKRAGVVSDIVASIAEVPDPIMRSEYIKESAKSLDTDYQLLISEVARKRMSHHTDPQTIDFIRRQQQQRLREHSTGEKAAIYPVSAGSSIEELEKELVKYLLKYGECFFDYKEGRNMISLNVAQVIISDLQANGLTFRNEKLRTLYDLYVSLSGIQEAENIGHVPLHHFINHPEPEVANTAVDILTDNDNYPVSRMWLKHDIVVESEKDRLGETVPRAVILYKSKAIESIIDTLQQQLKTMDPDDDKISDITYRIAALNKERIAISRKLSRLIL